MAYQTIAQFTWMILQYKNGDSDHKEKPTC